MILKGVLRFQFRRMSSVSDVNLSPIIENDAFDSDSYLADAFLEIFSAYLPSVPTGAQAIVTDQAVWCFFLADGWTKLAEFWICYSTQKINGGVTS